MKSPNIEKIVDLYYTKAEIGNKEIQELFSSSRATAQKLKRKAKELMSEEGKKCITPNSVLTEVAFRAWGIDIAYYEKQLKKAYQLNSKLGERRITT